ncbi:MAG: hypothetical protein R2684_07470 [Pyrinomonadaceae bacterium]
MHGSYTLLTDFTGQTAQFAVAIDGSIEFRWEVEAGLQVSAEFLPKLDRELRSRGISVGNLTELVTVSGPGSYTGLRVGIASLLGLSAATKALVSGFTIPEIFFGRKNVSDNAILVLPAPGRNRFFLFPRTWRNFKIVGVSEFNASEFANCEFFSWQNLSEGADFLGHVANIEYDSLEALLEMQACARQNGTLIDRGVEPFYGTEFGSG